jgi:hypothetical protein
MLFDNKLKMDWQTLCEELGFRFLDGIKPIIDHPKTLQMVKGQFGGTEFAQLQKMADSPLIQTIAGMMDVFACTGEYAGFEFNVFPGSQSSSSSSSRTIHYVNIGMFFKSSYSYSMKIQKRGKLAKKIGGLFGKQITIPNNDELNETVVVKGKKKAEIQTIISGSTVQTAISELFDVSGDFWIEDFGIRYKTTGRILPAEQITRLMDAMVKAGEAF